MTRSGAGACWSAVLKAILRRPRCAKTPEEIGVCDLVLIGLKTTANDQFARLLPPLVGPHTAVLHTPEWPRNEAQLAELFGREKIFGRLCLSA